MSKFLQVNQPVRLVAQFPIDLLITMFNGTASPYNVGCSSNNPRMALRDLCSLRAAWSAGGTQDARPNEFFILPTGNPASIMALIDDPISLTNLLPSPLIELDVTLEAYKLGIVSGRLRLQSPGVASGSSAIRLNYGNFDSAVIGMQTPKFEILASGDTKAAPGTFRVIDPFMAIANPMVYSVLPNGLKQSWQDAVNPYHCAPWRLHVDFPPGAVNMANALSSLRIRGVIRLYSPIAALYSTGGVFAVTQPTLVMPAGQWTGTSNMHYSCLPLYDRVEKWVPGEVISPDVPWYCAITGAFMTGQTPDPTTYFTGRPFISTLLPRNNAPDIVTQETMQTALFTFIDGKI